MNESTCRFLTNLYVSIFDKKRYLFSGGIRLSSIEPKYQNKSNLKFSFEFRHRRHRHYFLLIFESAVSCERIT